MFIQGNLQLLFDALYEVGVIDPVLKMDWSQVNEEIQNQQLSGEGHHLQSMFEVVNQCQGNKDMLMNKLRVLDEKSLVYLAMEVAREYAEFQDRKELH